MSLQKFTFLTKAEIFKQADNKTEGSTSNINSDDNWTEVKKAACLFCSFAPVSTLTHSNTLPWENLACFYNYTDKIISAVGWASTSSQKRRPQVKQIEGLC